LIAGFVAFQLLEAFRTSHSYQWEDVSPLSEWRVCGDVTD